MAIKTDDEILAMREGGKILAKILETLGREVCIGMTTQEIDERAATMMREFAVQPSFKGYRGYQAVTCTSVNEEVVHAIPGSRALQDGDILTIDCGVIHKGLHTDHAVTFFIGTVSPDIQTFVKTVERAMYAGIDQIAPGKHIGDIGAEIARIVENGGYSIIKEFIGHGVGHRLHEPPEVPNFGKKGQGPALVPGMTLAIEPIVAMGGRFTDMLADGWTAVTRDRSMAVQWEHTVLVTQTGVEILTRI